MLLKIIIYQRSVRKRFAKIASIISRPIVNDVGDGNDSTRDFNYIDSLCTFKERRMIAQIYTKCLNDDVTSILVANGNQVYFQDVVDTPELTGIQRGVSFVKNHLEVDATEIYPDDKQKEIYRLKPDELMKDAYINYCRVNHCIGENPNPDMVKQCTMKLRQELRWNFTRGGRE